MDVPSSPLEEGAGAGSPLPNQGVPCARQETAGEGQLQKREVAEEAAWKNLSGAEEAVAWGHAGQAAPEPVPAVRESPMPLAREVELSGR